MASRCPESVFIGRAVLRDYRWQINQRGVANVARSSSDSVEGLVYPVGDHDVEHLDLFEGVAGGFYEKQLAFVSVAPHTSCHDLKSSEVAKLLGTGNLNLQRFDTEMVGSGGIESLPGLKRSNSPQDEALHAEMKQVKVLIYISERYKDDGNIREEYISRMKKAIADALELGVSQKFVDENICPYMNSAEPHSLANHDSGTKINT